MIKFFKSYLIIIGLLTANLAFAQYDSISFGGIQRTYLLHLPSGYTGSEKLPLIIAMHGGFGTAYNLQNQSQLSTKADTENFMVVYPEGVKGQTLKVRTWNAGWCCGYAGSSNVDDVGFINALLDTLMKDYVIDTGRVYATGMSNGGFMSYRLVCELSGRIAAIAPVAASMSISACNPQRPVPVIHFHSYLDDNVPYQGGQGGGFSNHHNPSQDSIMTAWGNIDTCVVANDTIVNNEQYTFTKWHNCNCNTEIHHYITKDGGHSWPGGNATSIGDSVSAHLNANDLMWSFFQQYSLECATSTSVKEYSAANVSLFPNPTIGKFTLKLNDPSGLQFLTVTDVLGRVVLKAGHIEHAVFQADLTGNPDGLFLVSLVFKNGIKMDKKLVLLK